MAGYPDFAALYRAHVGAVYRYVFAQVGTRWEAEDLSAAVFEEALRRADLRREPAEIAAWLRAVARAAVARHWREHYRLPQESLAPWHDWEGVGATTEDDDGAQRELRGILDRLQASYREVLRLRFLEGHSLRETAERMGITEGNAKVLQYRALKKALELGGG